MNKYKQERELSEMVLKVSALSRELDTLLLDIGASEYSTTNHSETVGIMSAFCAMLAVELPEDNPVRQSFVNAFKKRGYDVGSKLVLVKMEQNNV